MIRLNMKIRIATWNMAYWSHKSILEEAWNYFLSLDADIFLFQEARRPEKLNNESNFIWHSAGESSGRKDWGTGIYSKKYELTEELGDSIPEWNKKGCGELCVIANTLVGSKKLTLISMYGRMDKIGNVSYSIANLHRILSDLTGIFNGHMEGKRNIILAGDLNASLQFDQQYGGQAHKIFFERLRDFKLENCFELNGNKDFIQTLRFPNSEINWQNDYFFISKSISSGFSNCEVVDNDSVRKFSDHNPVIITLEV